jgi:photosystem II stability/assembly factor-like uncharacterized protein
MPWIRSLRFLAAGSVAAAWALADRPAAAEVTRAEAPLDWFAAMASYYERHPELKTTPGSGWKPYNRIRFEWETISGKGGPPPPGARWRAWEEKTRRFSADGPAPRAAWFSLGPANFAGRILALAFDPDDASIVYAGSAGGGLWRSTSDASSWQPLTDGIPTLAVSGVAIHPSNGDILVIATGELPPSIVGGSAGVGILRSLDRGATWQTTSLTHTVGEEHGFHVVEAGPNGTFLAGALDGLWRSTDGGASWTQVLAGANIYDVKWKPGSASTVYAVQGNGGADNGVRVSTDDGLTFAPAGAGQPPADLIGKSKIAVTPDAPEYVYAIYEDKPGVQTTGIYRSTDGGATWTARNTTANIGGQQGWFNLSLAADPNDRERVFAGGIRLYRSTDGAQTWLVIAQGAVHVDHHDARYQPGSPNKLWIATDGGVFQTTDDGDSWADRNAGLGTFQFYDICVAQSDPTRLVGGTQDQGTDVRPGGSNFWNDGLDGDGMVCVIDPFNEDIIYGELQFGQIHKTFDGGENWENIENGLPPGAGSFYTPLDIDHGNPQKLWTMRATSGAGTWRTSNGGANWIPVNTIPAKSISISRVQGSLVWILDDDVLYTLNQGIDWIPAAPFPFPTGNPFRVFAHPTDSTSAFVTFTSYAPSLARVARTTDFGASWEDVTGDLPDLPVRAIAVDPLAPAHWFIGTDLGVWVTTNGGASWLPYSAGLPNAVVWDLEIQEAARTITAGTHGRGAWTVQITPPLSTSAGAPPPVAHRLMLDPPFPNPAREEVVLRWASKRPVPASLAVYDVRGRLVRRLDEQARGDGIVRRVPMRVAGLAAGIYFAVVEAGGERLGRKIVVVE